jgi:predicted transcriptional regulator
MKTFEIRIKTTEKALEEFARTFETLQAGKRVRKRKGIFFTSVEAARNLVTPERIKLLTVIRKDKPESIYQLARLCKRDQKNVHEDVKLLERYGILETRMRPGKSRTQRVPRVLYDEIDLRIPLVAQSKSTTA